MAEVKDVWVCGGGCETRQVGKPEHNHDCHWGQNGWFCCPNHSEKCDSHMCNETEKWLALGS